MTTAAPGKIVGLDGNDAPITIEGVPARLWLGITARALTYQGREPGDLAFGIGIVEALAAPRVDRAVWRRRLEASFSSLEGAEAVRFAVVSRGTELDLQVDIVTPEGVRRYEALEPVEVPRPAIPFEDLPPERWLGLWAAAPEQILVDMWPAEYGRYSATLDPATVHPSLLPAMAVSIDAFAFDAGGPVTQQRRAIQFARRLHGLVGTFAAFDLLMELNATTGEIRLVGDFDRAGNPVARDADNRRQGTHSIHEPRRIVRGAVVTYHREVAIDVVLPPDRIGDFRFVDYITRATRRTIPYTLEIAEVNVIQQSQATVRIIPHTRAVRTEYTYRGQLWR